MGERKGQRNNSSLTGNKVSERVLYAIPQKAAILTPRRIRTRITSPDLLVTTAGESTSLFPSVSHHGSNTLTGKPSLTYPTCNTKTISPSLNAHPGISLLHRRVYQIILRYIEEYALCNGVVSTRSRIEVGFGQLRVCVLTNARRLLLYG